MKKLLCLALCLLFLPLWAAGETEGYLSFVNGKTADRVHLRKAPSTDSESLGLFFTGTPVTCFSDPNQTWTKVKIGAQSGYMMSKFLSTADEADFEMVGKVKGQNRQIQKYAEPSEKSESSGWIFADEQVRILGETKNNWYYVHDDVYTGYVRSTELTIETVQREEMIADVPTIPLSSPYMSVLHKYYRAFVERWEWGKLLDNDMSEMCDFSYTRNNPLAVAGYMLGDMNGDGSPELLIGSLSDEYDQYMLFEMYALEKGKPASVVKSWARSRYYLCKNKVIGHEGANSAASGLDALMYLTKKNELDYIEVTMIEGDFSPEAPYWVSDEYQHMPPSGRMLTEEEYIENIRRYKSLRIQYPLTPFSTLRGTVGRIHVNGSVEGKTTVNIRAGQSLSSKALTSVKTGETVSVIAKNGDWCEVYYNGMHGFIQSQFVLIY